MRAIDLFNRNKEEFETNESFAKRVYDTAKRFRSSLYFNPTESWQVLQRLAKYYNEDTLDILSAIRDVELSHPSKKYRIQWVQCLGKHYLTIDKREQF